MDKIEVCYGLSKTIAGKQNYENEKPLFSLKGFAEIGKEAEEFKRLKSIVDPLAEEFYKACKSDNSNIRVRIKDGKKYPSVNSILSMGESIPMEPTLLQCYADRGTEIEKIVFDFIETGKWREPSVSIGNLKWTDIKYKEFFEKYGKILNFKTMQKKIEVYNDKRLYSGEIDIICEVDGMTVLSDWKTGSWLWKQVVAYGHCITDDSIEGYAIFDLKKCKIEVLTLEEAILHWEDFLEKRGAFRERFGL